MRRVVKTGSHNGSHSAGMSRRAFVRRVAALGAVPVALAAAQGEPGRVHRIGLLAGDDPEGGVAVFKDTLRELGHVEGRNLVLETRDSMHAPPGANLAAELARMDLELVVAHALALALGVRAANPDMPLVIVTGPALVSNGFAKSIEHPAGNATGIDELPPGVTARRLELLKTAVPSVSRVALLSTTPGRGGHEAQLADAQGAAANLNVTVKPYRATSLSELEGALRAIVADGMNGLLNFQGGLSYVNRQLIVDFAATHRLPGIYQATVFAAAGGLMTWAPDLVDQFRTAAGYVSRILNGARPGDLAITYPSRYFLTLNKSAAANLGLVLPPTLLARADRVLP